VYDDVLESSASRHGALHPPVPSPSPPTPPVSFGAVVGLPECHYAEVSIY
jgi:hypothetical protein